MRKGGENDNLAYSEPMPDTDSVTAAVAAARAAVMDSRHVGGHWCHELEADCTIPAEYVLMLHHFGEREPDVEAGIGNYLRRCQGADGGWPLYEAGAMDVSCSVKAYFALRLIGDDAETDHMRRAREAILACGGAARANVFTRITLAMYGDLPWRGVPIVPVEMVLLPRWFPINLLKVAYWSRTVALPLSVLCSMKAQAVNPLGVHVPELFVTPPEDERNYFATPKTPLARLFLWLDKIGFRCVQHMPQRLRSHALKRAERWLLPRLNDRDGLGAIFPAMVNACEALQLMGYTMDDEPLATARQALRDLLVTHGDETYCQPCRSPVWDTGLTCLALEEDLAASADAGVEEALDRALSWLRERQLLDVPGDWTLTHPDLPGGGWPFQYHNDLYPDLDDTAVMAWAMSRHNTDGRHDEAIARAADWLVGMQSKSGGFGAFDADNDREWLNDIPFADHGALIDPPSNDVSARVLMLLSALGRRGDVDACRRTLDYLKQAQEADGSWFGRWGTNYIYGTWSVLMALAAGGVAVEVPMVKRGADWLERHQRDDGSWGETNDSYFDSALAGTDSRGNATQTAWALLGLMAAGRVSGEAVQRGVQWLVDKQCEDGRWLDAGFNAPGFPRVFYLKYHGYGLYFPYWALARYRHLCGDGRD